MLRSDLQVSRDIIGDQFLNESSVQKGYIESNTAGDEYIPDTPDRSHSIQ